jgi:glucose-1-phosphate adenylyltransferase
VADGCIVEEGAVIEHSVIGLRCRIGRDVVIRDSVVMGNDYYQAPEDFESDASNGHPPLGIGPGTRIETAIIDKNCRIGRDVRIVRRSNADWTEPSEMVMVRDGVVVVTKGAVLPDGWGM